MKKTFTGLYLLFTTIIFSQNDIVWDGKYQLEVSDFQSSATQIGGVNVASLHTSLGVDFSFYMSNFEFMVTKNFNTKVNNTFKRESASLVAPDENSAKDLVDYARFQFDLTELYARKFRKKIFEEKGAFSNITFRSGIPSFISVLKLSFCVSVRFRFAAIFSRCFSGP